MCQSLISQEIIVFGNEDKAPKIYQSLGESKGILIDILEYVEQKSNYKFQINLLPWKRAFYMWKTGSGGVIGLSRNQEREAIFDFSTIVFYDQIMIVVQKGKEFEYNSNEDLRGKIVGHQRGGSYGENFELGKTDIFIAEEDNSPSQRLRKLLKGRIDVALIGPGSLGFQYILQNDDFLKNSTDQFSILETPYRRDPNYLGFAKSMEMTSFIQTFDEILSNGYENGDIEALINQYD